MLSIAGCAIYSEVSEAAGKVKISFSALAKLHDIFG